MTKIPIVFDIETIALPIDNERLERFNKEYKPPANYKDPLKIEAHKAKALSELSDKYRFRIDGCRPVSVSLGVCSGNDVNNILGLASDNSLDVARFFANYVSEFADFKLVGFNINKFDLPIMAVWMSRANASFKRRLGKWDAVDMCYFPLNQQGTMKEAARTFGLNLMVDDIGKEVDGMDVAQWYAEGKWDTILKYNKHDVLLEGQLYNHLRRIYDI